MPRLIQGNLNASPRISPSSVKAGILFILVPVAALAQIYPPGGGGYPGGGGGYPGGGGGYPGQSPYPGGQQPNGTSLPMPGRTGKNGKTTNDPRGAKNGQPLPNFRGAFKQMDEKTLSVELADKRVMDFRRDSKTRFFKSGDQVKIPKFNSGDQVSVEASEDPGGYMTAVNVYWEKAAGGAGTKTDDGVVDTWKDDPPKTTGSQTMGSEHATDLKAPTQRDADDPGPPRLKRGGVADSTREQAKNVPQTAPPNTPPADERPVLRAEAPLSNRPSVIRGDGDEDSVRIVQRPDQPLIRKAADAAMEFTGTLPSYVCSEMVTRSQSQSTPANFQAIDVVSMEVVYENGKEDYRNIQINGKKTVKKIEESGGSWSTGEFGTVLVDLFSPATAADFHFRRDSRTGGVTAKMYDFEVDREHSHWSIHSGSQGYNPAYSGSVWIDPATSRVLRIEMEAKGMPSNFPLDHVESATDYQNVRLGDAKQYLLPVHAETLSCERGTNYCSRNVIDFRNCHKYSGESSITFGIPAKDK